MEYSQQISPLKYMTKNQKKKEMKMTEEEKEKNRKILYNMNLKLNFKKILDIRTIYLHQDT